MYAALLNNSHPDSIDFDAVVQVGQHSIGLCTCFNRSIQQEKDARIDAVFSAAEGKLRIPKLVDSAALADSQINTMYFGLLYLALADTYKVRHLYLIYLRCFVLIGFQWEEFMKHVKPPVKVKREPVPQAPITINSLLPEIKPNFKAPIKQSGAK